MRRTRDQEGLTLVEILISLVIMGVVSSALITVWISLESAFSYSSRSSEQRESARDTLTLLAREIRDVQRPSPTTTISAITSAGPYDISYYTTFHDADATSVSAGVRFVRYWVASDPGEASKDALYRTIDDGPAQMVVKDIMNRKMESPIFAYSYFDDTGSLPSELPTSVPSDSTDRILTVRIRLIVDVNPGNAPSPMTLTTTVQPRNLRNT